jgi:predicted dehydrogenase
MKNDSLSRRAFLAATTSAAISVGCTTRPNSARVAPRKISPNERVNIAMIGCGGQGYENLSEVKDQNIVALCDADSKRAERAFSEYPTVKRYSDWRKLLDNSNDVDAVIVATPDHTHAPASVSAMRLGKHCYCEKPLAHSIHEARVMAATAKEYNLATQMGTQGVSYDGARLGIEWLRAGVLGDVTEIHVWTDRAIPGKWWAQGIERPKDTPPVPETLNWDVWLGTAPERPYNPAYLPFVWRGWKDFGSGAIGDMGIHNAALPFLGLNLGMPTSCKLKSSSPLFPETFPLWAELVFDFPASNGNKAIKFYWYDGGKKPDKAVFDGRELDGNGSITIGTEGKLYSPGWSGQKHFWYPEEKFKDLKPNVKPIPRTPTHHAEWIAAIKTGSPTLASFPEFATPMTEIMQLGNLAQLVGQDIEWDTRAMKATNCPAADEFIRPTYRKGWEIVGLG